MPAGVEIMAPPGMEEMQQQLQSCSRTSVATARSARKLKVKEAHKLLLDEEAGKLINEEELRLRRWPMPSRTASCSSTRSTRSRVARRPSARTSHAKACSAICCRWSKAARSRRSTATVKTDHILFIASGAFHMSKPSDLIPELQGRLPIRVELDSLKVEDFVRILTEPDASLTTQYQALMNTEGVNVDFTPERRAPHRRDRLPGQRAHREHRRAPAAHGDGAAARDRVVRCGGSGGSTIEIDAAYVDQHLARSPRTRTSAATSCKVGACLLLKHSRTPALRRRLRVGGSPE